MLRETPATPTSTQNRAKGAEADVSAPEQKRLRLLDAAAEHFASVGFAKATVEEIARAAGVSKGLLYVHFKSKEELLQATFARTIQQWGDATEVEIRREATARGALEAMHRASVAYAASRPLLYGIFAKDASLVRSLVREISEEAQASWHADLIELFERGRDTGEMRPDLDPTLAAQSYGLLHLAFLDRLHDADGFEITPELVDAAMALLLDGMCGGRS